MLVIIGTNSKKREASMDDDYDVIERKTSKTSSFAESVGFTNATTTNNNNNSSSTNNTNTSGSWYPAASQVNEKMVMIEHEMCNGARSGIKGNDDAAATATAKGRRVTDTGSGRPVVVGCTMIDMHVITKIDDHFKVSRLLPSWPVQFVLRKIALLCCIRSASSFFYF